MLRYAPRYSGEEGTMTAAHLWLAPVLVVIARWSTHLVIVFVSSGVLYTTMIDY